LPSLTGAIVATPSPSTTLVDTPDAQWSARPDDYRSSSLPPRSGP
jgi:hypothetical protein